MAGKPIPVEQRFWSKVQKTDGCWLWTAGKRHGYGVVGVTIAPGRHLVLMAHRVAWEMTYGKLPEISRDQRNDICVLHSCDNPPCVRPDHLFLGTQIDNMADRDRKKRLKPPPTKISDAHVREIRERYAMEGCTQEELSLLYGISRRQVGKLVNHQRRTGVA